jgi:hypothetical protein
LSLPPRPPANPSLFSSNPLFGEPGLYPDGSIMVPAAGSLLDDVGANEILLGLVDRTALAWFDEPSLRHQVPDTQVRCAVAILRATCAASLVPAFIAGALPVTSIGVAPTASPGRVVGPPASTTTGMPAESHRVLNERYAAEHPALVAPSLAHALLWRGGAPDQVEEVVLHAVLAIVHLQLVAIAPHLAHLGTELARRQNSLALTLLGSRSPGSATLRLVAPDGPGTIPGGDPAMQTPDFASIPFVTGPPPPPELAPTPLAEVLSVITGRSWSSPVRLDPGLLDDLATAGLGGALPPQVHLRAAVALGALHAEDLATVTGQPADDAAAWLGVDDALACFSEAP